MRRKYHLRQFHGRQDRVHHRDTAAQRTTPFDFSP